MFVLVNNQIYCGHLVYYAKTPDWVHHKRMSTHLSDAVQFDTPERAYYMKKRLNKSDGYWRVYEIDPSEWLSVKYSLKGNSLPEGK